MRRFVLLDDDDLDTDSFFRSRHPRQAALKAAVRVCDGNEVEEVRLREMGSNRVHVYHVSVLRIAAPENRPEWLPATIKKPSVQKVGVVRLSGTKNKKKRVESP